MSNRVLRGLAPAVALVSAWLASPLATAAAISPLATPTSLGRPTPTLTWAGRLVTPVTARVAPNPTARRLMTVRAEAPLGGGVTILQVTDRAVDATGKTWVRVRLPVRPNGTQGWIPADMMILHVNRLRIRVDVSDRTLTLFRSARPIMRVVVAVGAPETPTPTGHFAVAELIRTGDPLGFLGPVVFPITGFSNTLNEYAGGDGRVALHGTSLPELLGTRASHGCVRIHNRDVTALARLVRPGTPVDIVP